MGNKAYCLEKINLQKYLTLKLISFQKKEKRTIRINEVTDYIIEDYYLIHYFVCNGVRLVYNYFVLQ